MAPDEYCAFLFFVAFSDCSDAADGELGEYDRIAPEGEYCGEASPYCGATGL